jgi:hypothetical protein
MPINTHASTNVLNPALLDIRLNAVVIINAHGVENINALPISTLVLDLDAVVKSLMAAPIKQHIYTNINWNK